MRGVDEFADFGLEVGGVGDLLGEVLGLQVPVEGWDYVAVYLRGEEGGVSFGFKGDGWSGEQGDGRGRTIGGSGRGLGRRWVVGGGFRR